VTVASDQQFTFDNSFVRELVGLYEPWQATPSSAPELLALNSALAAELDLDADALVTPQGLALLAGNETAPGSTPIAMAYAGHQFGGFSPRLGDGRALLLGELVDGSGRRRDVHLKGSGRTPFARGGDGKAVVGPMLREYAISEAMYALGIPTTRALAVVGTGDEVARETLLPGAVLVRVAASHLRVGTFQYAAGHEDPELLQRLADYAIARHYPHVAEAPNPYIAFFEAVADAQASLIARWMNVGFIHGVMNTDNMTISGETIDYGPCAFMDAYDPATVFSSIDHGGRYAFGNQPSIAQWNLARLAETLLPLFDPDLDTSIELATRMLQAFPDRFLRYWNDEVLAKIGLVADAPAGVELANELLALMHQNRVDFTACFRALSSAVRGDREPVRLLFVDLAGIDLWLDRWLVQVGAESADPSATARAMDLVNPIYIPRNHLVEEALAAATNGDLEPFRRLVAVLEQPFTERPGLESYARPGGDGFGDYQTFCGT
jgi:serine/tyrosine/threonine adenylyltransferase